MTVITPPLILQRQARMPYAATASACHARADGGTQAGRFCPGVAVGQDLTGVSRIDNSIAILGCSKVIGATQGNLAEATTMAHARITWFILVVVVALAMAFWPDWQLRRQARASLAVRV